MTSASPPPGAGAAAAVAGTAVGDARKLPDPAWLFAALSGPFEPKDALLQPEVRLDDPGVLAMAATRLADVCDTSPAGASGRWLMRTPARHTLLLSLSRGALEQAARARVTANADHESVDLVSVLLDQPPLSRAYIEALVQGAGERAELERAILALDRAGSLAPAHDLLPPARSALSELRREVMRRGVSERGFVGRERECSQIAEWLSRPSSATAACLLVIAEPGMGKSTLLDEAVRRDYETGRPLMIRLDFDRAGLDVLDQVGLTMEAARQLAEQMGRAGTALLDARQTAGRTERDSDGRASRSFRTAVPEELASLMGTSVVATGRPVLVVLDTLEVLRGRGETHPARLFQWLDALLASGVRPMRVLGASRGNALDVLPEAGGAPSPGPGQTEVPRYRVMALPRLEDAAAQALLTRLSVPAKLFAELLEIAQGNPLKLRLAAEIAARTGIDKLPPRRRGAAVDAAFLYRFLLSRIADPALKELAHPGLIVRRINAALIRDVLAPKLGLGRISDERAQALLDQLAAHHWLVEFDPGTGFLKHRSDMRRLLLPLLYRSAPTRSARIDAAVIPWFSAIKEPWARNEAVYHQLQLTRRGKPAPSVSSDVAAQFDDDMLDELPQAAADLVRSARGQRTSRLRGVRFEGALQEDTGMTAEVLSAIERRDWFEGAHMVRQITEAGTLDVRSRTAEAVRAFLWRSGQWAEARRWLVERDRFHASDDDLATLPPTLALARLEMRAEFNPDRLRQRWRTQRDNIEPLVSAALSTGDNLARHGPLAFLLAERPAPVRFPLIGKEQGDLVAAAFERWADGGASDAFPEVAREGRARVERRVGSGWSADRVGDGRLLAMFTPYDKPLGNVAARQGRDWLQESAGMAAKTLADAGALLPGVAPPVADPPRSGAMSWLVDVGLFAEWLEALAFIRRDPDLQLIARSAARWRRTLAGDWALGRRRGGWRAQPPLDETLRERMGAMVSISMAQAQLSTWGQATGSDVQLMQRRLKHARAVVADLTTQGASPDDIATRLLKRGLPAAFTPSIAVGG